MCGLCGIGRFSIGIGISTDGCRVSFFLDEEVGGGPWKFLCGNQNVSFSRKTLQCWEGQGEWSALLKYYEE